MFEVQKIDSLGLLLFLCNVLRKLTILLSKLKTISSLKISFKFV